MRKLRCKTTGTFPLVHLASQFWSYHSNLFAQLLSLHMNNSVMLLKDRGSASHNPSKIWECVWDLGTTWLLVSYMYSWEQLQMSSTFIRTPLHHDSLVFQQSAPSPPLKLHQNDLWSLSRRGGPGHFPLRPSPSPGSPDSIALGPTRHFSDVLTASWMHCHVQIIKFYKQSHKAKVTASTADTCWCIIAGFA